MARYETHSSVEVRGTGAKSRELKSGDVVATITITIAEGPRRSALDGVTVQHVLARGIDVIDAFEIARRAIDEAVAHYAG